MVDEFAAGWPIAWAPLKMGRGTEEGSSVGPLIDAKQRDSVVDLVDDAVSERAPRSSAAERTLGSGLLLRTDRPFPGAGDAKLLREEIFGPVAPIVSFDREEEAVHAANATEYGLVAYVYTSDLDRAVRVAEGIKAGMVGLNQGVVSNPAAPFGVSSSRGSVAKAAGRASRSTWTSSTSPSKRARELAELAGDPHVLLVVDRAGHDRHSIGGQALSEHGE